MKILKNEHVLNQVFHLFLCILRKQIKNKNVNNSLFVYEILKVKKNFLLPFFK